MLERTRARDKRKKELCDKEGVRLAYFDYKEDLTHDLVKQRDKHQAIDE